MENFLNQRVKLKDMSCSGRYIWYNTHMTSNNEKGAKMTDQERYELHLKLTRILRPDYFITFEWWEILVKNAEKELQS